MPTGDAKDIRDHTRAMKELAHSNERLIKVCEALNENLVIFARLYRDNHPEETEKTDICVRCASDSCVKGYPLYTSTCKCCHNGHRSVVRDTDI